MCRTKMIGRPIEMELESGFGQRDLPAARRQELTGEER